MARHIARAARRRPRVGAATIATRMIAYFALAWGTIAAVMAGAFPGAWIIVLLLAAYTMIPVVAFAAWRGWPFYPRASFRLFVMRPFWYTQLVLPLVTAGALMGMLGGLPFGHALIGGRVAAGTVLAIAITVLILGYVGSQGLVVRHVDVDVPGLPSSFDGLRIAQLSDLHIGPHTSRRFLRRVVSTTGGLEPDLIAVTGDLIDDRSEDVAVYSRRLRSLAAPLGVFMIPGNHDVYAGWDDVER
ncbi:MAG TPA: metallophosphoesterase, partial [Gemmatimonadaceae bacterium]|nr:metallophosphoesterase [Gemmatimonadaceae bacterium]